MLSFSWNLALSRTEEDGGGHNDTHYEIIGVDVDITINTYVNVFVSHVRLYYTCVCITRIFNLDVSLKFCACSVLILHV